jgi:hypothetical protein
VLAADNLPEPNDCLGSVHVRERTLPAGIGQPRSTR